MKLLIISAVFPPEPVVSAKLSYDIASSLSRRNAVTVISPKPSRPFGFQFTGELMLFQFNHLQVNSFICASYSFIGRFIESYSFGRSCYKYISENHRSIEVIYANTWPLFGQYFTIKAAYKYNIPTVIHIQDIYPESLTNKIPFLRPLLNFVLLPIDKYVLRKATKIITISERMKNHLAKTRKIGHEKMAVVQNWQDESVFINFKSIPKQIKDCDKPFTYMYLGNIGPVARIDFLIESFAKADLKNCRLIIAGAGSMKRVYQKEVSELNLTTIEFYSVSEGQVPAIQDLADVMLLPIKKRAASSSIPSKLPAYMFSKKPIIACVDEDSDTANAIILANCGWVLPPDDQNSLIRTMRLIASLPGEELHQKGKNGFLFALEHFSKQNNLEQLVTMINEIISV
jgi:glycosyltransferase involved in cell wall biosynthesis